MFNVDRCHKLSEQVCFGNDGDLHYFWRGLVDGEAMKTEQDAEKGLEGEKREQTSLEKFWKAVRDNPSDFTGWTYLLQYVEQQVRFSKLSTEERAGPPLPEDDQTWPSLSNGSKTSCAQVPCIELLLHFQNDLDAAREAFDAFLARYPYCYGYWKKYAELESNHDNMDEAEKVEHRVTGRVRFRLLLFWWKCFTHILSKLVWRHRNLECRLLTLTMYFVYLPQAAGNEMLSQLLATRLFIFEKTKQKNRTSVFTDVRFLMKFFPIHFST